VTDRLARLVGPAALAMTVLATVLAGVLVDLGVALLVLAAAALFAAIGALWASLQALSGNVPLTIDEAIALAHADAADERKREILQTLKDLELDYGVGKIGSDDYHALLSRYRGEAKGLLRASDENAAPVRARAAAYVQEHRNPVRPAGPVCGQCQASNEHDAVFCKKCGARLSGVPARTDEPG
jgi:ribosomal protein L40E